MNCKELKEFIKRANKENLSPIEKDVYLYYYSCTRNDKHIWFCPDSEVAENTFRSRSGVCDARKKLIKRKWISESSTFQIKTLVEFSVSNETQVEDSQSEIGLNSLKSDSPVSNETEKGKISVSNETPYKDKLNLEVEVEIKKEENTQEPCACETGEFSQEEIRAEIEPQSETLKKFETAVWKGLSDRRLDSPFENPKWQVAMNFVFAKQPNPTDFFGCIDWIETWARGRPTAEMVANNFGKYLSEKEKTTNGNKPDWQKAIDNCEKCDKSGRIEKNGIIEVCKHK